MSVLKPVNEEDHILGNKNAPVTLIEYGDFECPMCGQAFHIVKLIEKHFGDSLRFVFRHFPLTEVHPFAEAAAQTAEFANEHGKFWQMHELIYENQQSLSLPLFFDLAKELKLPEKDLKDVLETGKYREKIKSDFMSGVYSGVNGTPTFFVNGKRYIGVLPFEEMVAIINSYLT